MGCQVIFAPQALTDLAEVVGYIAQDDPLTATRIGHELVDRVRVLEDFPNLGTPYPKRKSVRMLHSPPFVIYYRVKPGQSVVEILRYWHGARGTPPLR